MSEYSLIYNSIIGNICIKSDGKFITSISLINNNQINNKTSNIKVLLDTKKQLEEYFSLKRKEFDIPIKFNGTDFQNKVWNSLFKIPYGHTVSYSEIAKNIGNPKASRAVGMACNKNPIMIIVPCHRVIGKNKKLVGYAGGLDIKQKLLDLESGRNEY